MKTILSICFLFAVLNPLSAQTVAPVSTIEHVRLLGMVNLKEEGTLFISSEKKNKEGVRIFFIDASGLMRWNRMLPIVRNRNKSVSRIWIGIDGKEIYWLRQADGWIFKAILNAENGQINQSESKWIPWSDKKMLPLIQVVNRQIYFAEPNPSLVKHSVTVDAQTGTSDTFLLSMPGSQELRYVPAGFSSHSLLACSYAVNKSHSVMNLLCSEFSLTGKSLRDSTYTFELKDHSFAFNALNDNQLFYAIKEGDHLNLIGKLDVGNQLEYLPKLEVEQYTGFWIARIDSNMALSYFKIHAFRDYKNTIPAGNIRRPVFMDFKEDDKKNLYIQLAEIPDALSYNSYLFELNDRGDVEFATGGMSEYNFFQFNHKGIRHVAAKSKLRLVNDDWRYYATNFLDEIKPNRNRPSSLTASIQKIGKKSGFTHDRRAYNFARYSKNHFLIFEYLDIRGGRLNVYKPDSAL